MESFLQINHTYIWSIDWILLQELNFVMKFSQHTLTHSYIRGDLLYLDLSPTQWEYPLYHLSAILNKNVVQNKLWNIHHVCDPKRAAIVFTYWTEIGTICVYIYELYIFSAINFLKYFVKISNLKSLLILKLSVNLFPLFLHKYQHISAK